MAYSFENFKEDIKKRNFQEKGRHYKRMIEVIEPYIDESKIKCFYPKNLFNGNEEKEFIFFLEKYFIFVKFQKEERYFVNCIPIPKGEFSLEIPEYKHQGITLSFKIENEDLLTLNSAEDSNENWNDEYIESINDIYSFLLER